MTSQVWENITFSAVLFFIVYGVISAIFDFLLWVY